MYHLFQTFKAFLGVNGEYGDASKIKTPEYLIKTQNVKVSNKFVKAVRV